MHSYVASENVKWCHLIWPTLYMCSRILYDSVAVKIFTIGQPCAKIFRKVRCATFFETRCIVCYIHTAQYQGLQNLQHKIYLNDTC